MQPKRSRLFQRSAALFVVLVLLGYLGWSSLAVPQDALAGTVTLENSGAAAADASDADVTWPAYGQAALGTQGYGLVASHGNQTSAPIASIAKIMTALSILKQKPLELGQQGPTITLTQADVDLYNMYVAKDGSVALVAAGEKISEYQALQALLLPSANNMADSLVNWAFGSMSEYTVFANQYAEELGLNSSHFADASGFSPQTVSSATDLVKLGKLALDHPVIAQIVAQDSATIPVAGTIHNVNSLLDDGDGFVGIKTGNTEQAGGCMLFAADYEIDGQTVTIIGAIMGAPRLWNALRDSSLLLASAKQNFVHTTVVEKGQTVGHYATPWGPSVAAVAEAPVTAITWKGTNISTTTKLLDLTAPKQKGDRAGTIKGTAPSTSTRSMVAVRLADDIPASGWWWRATHPLKTWQLRFEN